MVSNPHVYKVNYDPLKDLMPVIQISRQPIVMAAHPELGAKTIAELIALAKKQPGIRFGTGSGAGSQQHMAPRGSPRSRTSNSSRCPIGAAAKRSTTLSLAM